MMCSKNQLDARRRRDCKRVRRPMSTPQNARRNSGVLLQHDGSSREGLLDDAALGGGGGGGGGGEEVRICILGWSDELLGGGGAGWSGRDGRGAGCDIKEVQRVETGGRSEENGVFGEVGDEGSHGQPRDELAILAEEEVEGGHAELGSHLGRCSQASVG